MFAHLITVKTVNSIKMETFGKVGRGQSLQLFSGMHFSNINNKNDYEKAVIKVYTSGSFVLLLYVPSQQLLSWWDGQFT